VVKVVFFLQTTNNNNNNNMQQQQQQHGLMRVPEVLQVIARLNGDVGPSLEDLQELGRLEVEGTFHAHPLTNARAATTF
jgi:hypothetical protein